MQHHQFPADDEGPEPEWSQDDATARPDGQNLDGQDADDGSHDDLAAILFLTMERGDRQRSSQRSSQDSLALSRFLQSRTVGDALRALCGTQVVPDAGTVRNLIARCIEQGG